MVHSGVQPSCLSLPSWLFELCQLTLYIMKSVSLSVFGHGSPACLASQNLSFLELSELPVPSLVL